MKIKKSQLETLIKEELNNLDEISLASVGSGLKAAASGIKSTINKTKDAYRNSEADQQRMRVKASLIKDLNNIQLKMKEALEIALKMQDKGQSLTDKFQDGTARPFDPAQILDGIYRINTTINLVKKDLDLGRLSEKRNKL